MAPSGIKPDQVLDCRGLLCPLPVIKTSKAITSIAVGQILEVLATDPGSKPDFQAWSKQTGHELLEVHEEGGVFRFLIRRTH
ncbi:MAG: sulfurtransferase TusA family protein [Thermoflexus sp.]|jgi:tRNA 2-thiouridine synthesizing protein A|nr:sulfurtransferase TusA family protein [Thermoflexus sp.]MDT7947195.1 sulfurtransferase TusA family protein [Thermoflexus sp.]